MTEEPTRGRWGINKKGTQVHYFMKRTDNGRCESLCGRMRNYDEGLNARLGIAENWDEHDPRTCKSCRQLRAWVKGTEAKKQEPEGAKVN